MLETRLDMQRAKLESIERAKLRRADELSCDSAGADTGGLSPIDMADLPPGIETAAPITA